MRRKTVRSLLVSLVVGALGFLTACGGSSNSTPVGVPTPPSPGQNVQPITVDGGPLGNYTNGAFVSVDVCVPGTSTCQTVDHILVDTGSFGLRILGSQLNSQLASGLQPLTDSSGDQVNDCIQFLDNSFLWGTVDPADIKMAGEVASATSIQVIANPTAYSIPTSCSTTSNGMGVNEDTQQLLGANGILGVGLEPFDCGPGCDPSSGTVQPLPYFLCSTSIGCQPTPISCGTLCGDTTNPNQQVTNPVFNFTGDNNGVILEFPAVADAAATVTGSMIFGIGTQSNNALGTATVFTLEPMTDNFTTTYKGQAYSNSFIDSGSNGLFFQDATIPACAGNLSFFYCPTSNLSGLTATNTGANGATNTVTFGVDNAQTLFTNNTADFAFSNLGGPLTGQFDWGLPFFYNRHVFTAIDGATPPTGVPAGPFFAY
jgi:Protein of unknown function (DUF3443)